MRLWHPSLIRDLDSNRLCDLHQTCCNMRGNGWGKKNRLIDWVWKYGENKFYEYHSWVLTEMDRRGFNFEVSWLNPKFCGWNRKPRKVETFNLMHTRKDWGIYPEMDGIYLMKDIRDLRQRGAKIPMYVGRLNRETSALEICRPKLGTVSSRGEY